MEGYYLEQRYYQRAPAYFSKIVRRVRAVSYEDPCRLLDDALDADALTEAECDDLIETDVVVYGRRSRGALDPVMFPIRHSVLAPSANSAGGLCRW
ncbi:MAG: hypothetical protein KatS3mg022_1017 [Armatimonadota bacterium]|nr:MAG: hypothetical protein KatS3mg022_1017 [Armatimonadota bacterium]